MSESKRRIDGSRVAPGRARPPGRAFLATILIVLACPARAQVDPCGRTITVGNGLPELSPPEGGPHGPAPGGGRGPRLGDPPSEIQLRNEARIELTASITPPSGAVRSRHEISLHLVSPLGGQLEFTLPLGIGGKGRGDHALWVDLILRSGVERKARWQALSGASR